MSHHPHRLTSTIPTSRQQGVTLIELMVGIAIGLLVIAVAMGALMVSRGVSSTVSEASTLQQQASYAFRVIGQQIRQAGSMELRLTPDFIPTTGLYPLVPVAFDPPDPTGQIPPFDRKASTLTGDTSPTLSFTVGYQNYTETVTPPPSSGASASTTPVTSSLLRDCLGQNKALSSGGSLTSTPVLTSTFKRNSNNELVCEGAGSSGAQAIIGNVTDMQVRYIEQAAGTANLQYRTSADPGEWTNIYAIEVCLELTGTEHTPTASATYKNCSGADTSYGDRLKMVFRNVYQIRSQGQV